MKDHSPRLVLTLALLMGLLLTTSTFATLDAPCVVSRINGQLQISPPGCHYDGPEDLTHGEGAENLLWDPIHAEFTNLVMHEGGILHGAIEEFDSIIIITLTGTGELEGYRHTVRVPAHCETHTSPWNGSTSMISFDAEMVRIEGELEGDSEFESLRIVAGSDYGYRSPGRTTATSQDGKKYVVDSMFNIGFRIDFVGARGSALEGLSGSFEGNAVMKAYGNPTSSEPEPGGSSSSTQSP